MAAPANPLIATLSQALTRKGWQAATAESCTGGLLAAALTAAPGASDWYAGGVIAYHNRLKERLLAVKPHTLATHGAVSEQTAAEMCLGLATHFPPDNAPPLCAVSTTGIAGPTGGTPNKPIGTVCFATLTPAGAHVETRHFTGDRPQIRTAATAHALALLAAAAAA